MSSVRPERLCSRVTKFTVNNLKKRSHDITIFDPLEKKLGWIEKPVHWYRPGEQVPKHLEELATTIKNSDAFVVVSGEYNQSIPPPLSNMMDHFGAPQYGYKPSAIVTYSIGMYGGARVGPHLRTFLDELGTPSIPMAAHFGKAHEIFTPEGEAKDPGLEKALSGVLNQLEFYAAALRDARQKYPLPQ